jgi:hypothetical protein
MAAPELAQNFTTTPFLETRVSVRVLIVVAVQIASAMTEQGEPRRSLLRPGQAETRMAR